MKYPISLDKLAALEGDRRRREEQALVDEIAHPVRRLRLREVAFRPSLMTSEENQHVNVEGCSICALRLTSMRRVVHPSLMELLAVGGPAEDVAMIEQHCDDCSRCGKLRRLSRLGDLLRGLPSVLARFEQVKEWVDFAPAETAFSYEPTDRIPKPSWKHSVQLGNLNVVIRRMEGDMLFVGVTSREPEPEFHRCYIALVREGITLERTVDWERDNPSYQGRAFFKYSEFARGSGTASVMAVPYREE